LTTLLCPLAVLLLLAMPGVSVQDDAACRPPPREILPDTNVYVCPPSVSGQVTWAPAKNPGAICYGAYDPRMFSSHGYASFDLGELPDSIAVLSTSLRYYQYACGGLFGPTPVTDLTLIPDVKAPAGQLFTDIYNGLAITPSRATFNGWIVRPFNSCGVAAVDSCRVRGESIDLGVRGGQCPFGSAYGVGPYHPLRAYLEIQYWTNASYCDIVAAEAAFDSFPLAVGDSIVVRGRFTNTGNSTAYAVPVCASCTGTTGDTVIVDSLAPDETSSVRIALPPAAEPGIASLVLCADVQGDWCRYNDTAIKSTYVFPRGTRSVEDFEVEHSPSFPPSGWVVISSDTNTWHRAGPGDRIAHSGDYYASCGSTGDWLVTYGLSPDSSSADTVGFFLSAATSASWCKAQVWALTSQNPSDTLDVLLEDTLRARAWREYRIGLDQLDGQVVYIGLRNPVATGVPLQVDDVWFTSERAPGVEEQADASLPRLMLTPNPARRGFIRLSCQLAGSGPLDVEISDILGRVVSSERVIINAIGAAEINCRHLAAGVYFVSLRSTSGTARKKLVIQ